jgi:hypothetical protein
LTFQSVDDIHGCDCLPLGVLCVCDCITDENKSTCQAEEREEKVLEKEEQRDIEKCCVIISKELLNQPSVVLPGEVVSNVSLVLSQVRFFLKNVGGPEKGRCFS